MSELIRGSPYVSGTPSPYPSHPASDSPSPSSSFRGDRTLLLTRKHTIPLVLVSGRPCCHGRNFRTRARSSSLDDIRVFRKKQKDERHRRCASARGSRKRKSSVPSEGRKESRRNSSVYGLERSRSGSTKSRRTSTSVTPISTEYVPGVFEKDLIDEEILKKHRRHRIAFWLVLGSFIFIAFSSILVVMVTLTHQSEYNNTLTYYTFAKPSSLAVNQQQKSIRSEGE